MGIIIIPLSACVKLDVILPQEGVIEPYAPVVADSRRVVQRVGLGFAGLVADPVCLARDDFGAELQLRVGWPLQVGEFC